MDTITNTTDPTSSTSPGGTSAPDALAPDHGVREAVRPPIELVRRAIAKRSFAMLATTSSAGNGHAAGVLYAAVDDVVYVSTLRDSRKARNIAANPAVGVCIPMRRLPVGPPSSVQFQARAAVIDVDDPEVLRLVEAGRLKAVTSHGELELPGGCFVRIVPNRRLHAYGLGMSIWSLLRNPLAAGGFVDLDPVAPPSRAALVR